VGGQTEGRNVAAAIFWLKTRAGWRETDRREITGAGGEPLTVSYVVRAPTPVQSADEWLRPARTKEPA
jgi:hypothetical protein